MAAHLEKEGLQFIQFAFRWVNCLLLREVPFALGVRLWDTYLSEGCAKWAARCCRAVSTSLWHGARWHYQSQGSPPPCRSQFKDFLAYTLAAFLLRCGFCKLVCDVRGWAPSAGSHPQLCPPAVCSWSEQLKQLEFQELIMFLQKPATAAWGEKDIELVLSRAYMWRASFKGAASHFA